MPVLIGIGSFISTVWGFFSTGGPILAFFVWIGKKLVMKYSMVQVQFAITGIFFVSKALFLVGILDVIRRIYNKTKELLDTLPTTLTSSPSLDIPYKFMQSIGIIDAFIDAFSVFVLMFTSILLLFIGKMATKALQQIKEDFRDIAMMMMV